VRHHELVGAPSLTGIGEDRERAALFRAEALRHQIVSLRFIAGAADALPLPNFDQLSRVRDIKQSFRIVRTTAPSGKDGWAAAIRGSVIAATPMLKIPRALRRVQSVARGSALLEVAPAPDDAAQNDRSLAHLIGVVRTVSGMVRPSLSCSV
jgi:hypothetical protein